MENKRLQKIGMWSCMGILFFLTFIMVKIEMGKGHEVLLYSDFATHSSWAVGELTDPLYNKFYAYPLWHFLVRLTAAVLPVGREYAGALVTAAAIAAAAGLLHQFLEKRLGKQLGEIRVCALTISLLVLTAVYMPWFNREVYLGQSSPTIWHNPTNMAVKPLTLLAFLLFADAYADYKNCRRKTLVGLSAVLLVSCFVKPSLVQGFLPAMVLFLLYELIRTRGDTFGFSLKMAAVFVPSGLYFLFQFLAVFGQESQRTIGISPFTVMCLDTPHPLFSMVQAVAFPLFVLGTLGWKKIREDSPLLFTLVFYVVTLLQFILLIEVTEPASGNFEWALQLALFLLFVMTACRFYEGSAGMKPWQRTAGTVLLGLHVLSGIYYYIYLFALTPLQC